MPEHLAAYASAISQLLQTVYNGEGIKPDDDRDTVPLTVNKRLLLKKSFRSFGKRSA